MNTVRVWTFISVTVIALTAGRGSLRAQPAGDAVTVEGDDKPWNQGVPLDSRMAARELFKEGNRRFNIPLFAQAAEQYAAALRLWRHPAFYFNLSLAELNLGQDVEARDNLEQAIVHGLELFDMGDFQEAKKQRQDLEHKLARLRIACQTDGAEVALDGTTLFVGSGSRDVWVKPRAHEITAKKPEYLSEARRVTVNASDHKSLELWLITLSDAEDSSRRWKTWKPWAIVAAGAVIGVGAVALHVRASGNFNSYDTQFSQLPCAQGPHPKGCPSSDPEIPLLSSLNAQLRTARREQEFTVGGYIASSSLIVTGIALLYMNRIRLPEQNVANLSPIASNDMVGVAVSISR